MLTMVRRILSVLAVFVATDHCGVAHAAWPSDPTVNGPLCTAAGDQHAPTIISDGARGAIITWEDKRGGYADIYAQRVNSAGVPLWTAGGVALCTAAFNQFNPTIASDGAGGAIVTWEDYRSYPKHDIYAQRVNAAGVPQWAADGVGLCTAANDQIFPTIISDGAGGAIVTWQDARSTNYDIYAQRVNAAGLPQWTADGVGLCTAANDQIFPTIISDGAGGAIVIWQDARSTNYDIYAQRVNAAGVPQWTANGVGLCTAANDQSFPTVSPDVAGGAIVTWQDARSTNNDIYAQRVNAAGLPQWTADGVGLCTAANNQSYPTIASDGVGGAIVTWYDYRSSNAHIYAQRVNTAGVPQWTADGVALCTAAYHQISPATISVGASGAIVTWYDYRNGYNYDIYAQQVNAAGVPQWTADGVGLCTAANDQEFPAIVSDGASGAIVAWEDKRSGTNSHIYAQNIKADGTLGGTLLSAPPLSIAASFALRSIQPNPSVGDLRVSFSLLDDSPASLELYDLTGRRIESRAVGGLGPGAHGTSLTPRAVPPGVYCVSLTQGSHRAFSKVVIFR